METRANYALIGIFTLAVLAAGFGFVYWFSGRDAGGKRETYNIIFQGSVSGLGAGSLVLFNGLRVGEVTSIAIDQSDPNRVVATVSIDRSTPVKQDTKARLEVQLLSGAASIALAGGQSGSPDLKPKPGQPPPVIIAERSDFQDIVESVRNVARRADDVLAKAETVLDQNQQPIANTIRNVEKFSQALGDNSEGINRFLASVGDAAEKIGPLAEKLQTLATDFDNLITAVDRNKVARVVDNVDRFTASLDGVSGEVQSIARNAASLTAKLDKAADDVGPLLQAGQKIGPLVDNLNGLANDLGGLVRAVDRDKVTRTVDNVDKFASALGSGTPEAQTILKNAASISAKLDKAADQVEGVLKAAEGFLNSPDGKGAFQQVAEAARSIRVLADNLDKRTAEITTGINRFTGPGLKELEALATDGRRTLSDIDRTLRNVERNPQQFIFGAKPPIPAYNGRR